MDNYFDILQLLKRFGIYIYTGNRNSDKALCMIEIKELYQNKLISQDIYLKALMILKRHD